MLLINCIPDHKPKCIEEISVVPDYTRWLVKDGTNEDGTEKSDAITKVNTMKGQKSLTETLTLRY